jgi:hypothetical protein
MSSRYYFTELCGHAMNQSNKPAKNIKTTKQSIQIPQDRLSHRSKKDWVTTTFAKMNKAKKTNIDIYSENNFFHNSISS